MCVLFKSLFERTIDGNFFNSTCFDQDGVEYRVNVYSLAEHEGMVVESEACHVKVSHTTIVIINCEDILIITSMSEMMKAGVPGI